MLGGGMSQQEILADTRTCKSRTFASVSASPPHPRSMRELASLVIPRGNQFRYRHQRPLIRRCRELANDGAGLFREGLRALLRTLDPAMAMQHLQNFAEGDLIVIPV